VFVKQEFVMTIDFSLSRWTREASYAESYAGSGVVNTIVGALIIFSAIAFGAAPALANFFRLRGRILIGLRAVKEVRIP
jgi:hypothetical protein